MHKNVVDITQPAEVFIYPYVENHYQCIINIFSKASDT